MGTNGSSIFLGFRRAYSMAEDMRDRLLENGPDFIESVLIQVLSLGFRI